MELVRVVIFTLVSRENLPYCKYIKRPVYPRNQGKHDKLNQKFLNNLQHFQIGKETRCQEKPSLVFMSYKCFHVDKVSVAISKSMILSLILLGFHNRMQKYMQVIVGYVCTGQITIFNSSNSQLSAKIFTHTHTDRTQIHTNIHTHTQIQKSRHTHSH